MSCRVSTPEATGCRSKLRFKQPDIILSKKQSAKTIKNNKIILE